MKSAKRLNRKVVKSRLTKKRRQVGRGNDTYTLKFNNGKSIAINVNTDTNTVSIDESKLSNILEPRLPTLEQYNEYATNFIGDGAFKTVPGTGLFVVNEGSDIEFYKLSNSKSEKLIKVDNTITVGGNMHDTFINGMNITHIGANNKEPVLIQEQSISRRRLGAIKRHTRNPAPDNVAVNFEDLAPMSSIGPASLEVFNRTPGPPLPPRPSVRRSSSGSKRKSSSRINVSGLYAQPNKSKSEQPPPLPPKKPAPYKPAPSTK